MSRGEFRRTGESCARQRESSRLPARSPQASATVEVTTKSLSEGPGELSLLSRDDGDGTVAF